jgi:nitrogenase subunit NifH
VVPFLADAISMSQLPAVESGRFTGGLGQDGHAALTEDRVGFVLNQLDVRTRLGRATADAAVLHLGTKLVGIVQRDEHVPEAIAAQRLVVDVTPEARASQEMVSLAQAISARLAAGSGPAQPPAQLPRMRYQRPPSGRSLGLTE